MIINEEAGGPMISAEKAIERLKKGNQQYVAIDTFHTDVSPTVLEHFAKNGQEPYAIIIGCSDSRVIPERIFHAAIGDLFTIRVAGNVIDDHQLGSIEYAAGHLGTNLIVVLGHTQCGAVTAAIHHDPDGYIKYITDEIKQAIGAEKDDYKATVLNVRRSVSIIESSLEIQKDEEHGLKVIGAVYRIEDGTVEFGV
ncbi:MAG: carbonic anhydrase [Lachnospiraceae bacterium]|nr:carbonic anhydrase [Lachnospiraceae bacterium]